jgi:hypothetical protein
MLSILNLNSIIDKNNILYLLPIYILNRIDMSQLFVFSSGLITGAYLAQNYNLPDVKTKINEILDQMKTMEKSHNKNNDNNDNN